MTNTRTITEAEAIAILTDENAEHLPFRTITESGAVKVLEFVRGAAKDPDSHNIDAWIDQAHTDAGNVGFGEAIIMEMPGRMTQSGNPECLHFDESDFEWIVTC